MFLNDFLPIFDPYGIICETYRIQAKIITGTPILKNSSR
jgi:hypothetical protein